MRHTDHSNEGKGEGGLARWGSGGLLAEVADLGRKDDQIGNAEGEHYDSTDLSAHRVGGDAHQEREDGSAGNTHDHQSRDLIVAAGQVKQSLREEDGENVGIAVTNQRDADVERCGGTGEVEAGYGHGDHDDAQQEEMFGRIAGQDESPTEGADGAEEEVEACSITRISEGHADALHEQFGGGGVGADVDADVHHNADKEHKHEGRLKQR